MKNDEVYPYYISYLEYKLIESSISNGSFSLFKISKYNFDSFKYRFKNDEMFELRMIKIYKSSIRNSRIDDILNIID